MSKFIRVGLAQINVTVGDLKGNAKKIKEFISLAKKNHAHFLAFPKMCITGYPLDDLVFNKDFVEANLKILKEITEVCGNILTIIGFVDKANLGLYDACALIYDRNILGIYHGHQLGADSSIDRIKSQIKEEPPIIYGLGDINFGIITFENTQFQRAQFAAEICKSAQIIFILDVSPFSIGKAKKREEMLRRISSENEFFTVYANLVGGQDELVFDGNSMVLDSNGKVIAKAPAFKEHLLVVDIEVDSLPKKTPTKKEKPKEIVHNYAVPFISNPQFSYPTQSWEYLDPVEEIYEALILGLKDYVKKNGFDKVVLGLSGGIDSSLVATIACDALGNDSVKGVFMPSPYTSVESKEDVYELVKNLKIELFQVPITEIYETYLKTLSHLFKGLRQDITEENIQARIRGNILMAISNKFGWLVLTTGNKSESSVGYATLYGDMAGGFAVIKDVPKTMVYELARFRNKKGKVIPDRVLIKEPSAELRPGQKDRDTLPPYDILDQIINAYVEEEKTLKEIVELTGDRALVERVIRMIDGNEYKRRQGPPGIKVTSKAFGVDRKMPITNAFIRSY